MAGRTLSEADRAAWSAYARLVRRRQSAAVATAAPLASQPVASPSAALPPAAPPPAAPPPAAPLAVAPLIGGRPAPAIAPRPPPLVVGDAPGGVDGGTWRRFRSGRLPPARTLDLHGRSVARAHAALEHFLHVAAAEGVRCVEIITGQGRGEGTGAIRREFPLWLNAPHLRALVLAAAHPHAANSGAVRLLLRRPRGPAGATGPRP